MSSISPSQSNLAWFLVAFELGPWEEYLIHELTPDLEKLSGPVSPRISWLMLDERALLPDFAVGLMQPDRFLPGLSLIHRNVVLNFDGASPAQRNGQRLERSMLMPGVSASMADRGLITVSAVLATQRFVSAGMNLDERDEPIGSIGLGRGHHRPEEVAHGAGIRFALSGELMDRLSVQAAYQSRIDMNEFASVRGVHGSRAELDIPSRLQVGMQLKTSARTSVSFGVSQIFYSEVGAFPSRSLPARFNALLGDSTSPQFDWDDLLVYSLGWSWQHDELELFMDYRTRSQPRPSAPSLASALASELAQNAFMVGVNKGFGERSRLQLNAAYAPPEYAFGGNVLGIVSDRLDQSLELQATWRVDF
ncbi:MAG: hypothetical protein EA370_17215 [Wenzhouxiangella sp.]|nr:MAG: hypothetical protein EA370_17215 [Wenzhouxiangella sp.]